MANRGTNGESNICKRKDDHWEGRYTADRTLETSKAIWNILGKTQAEASEKPKHYQAERIPAS